MQKSDIRSFFMSSSAKRKREDEDQDEKKPVPKEKSSKKKVASGDDDGDDFTPKPPTKKSPRKGIPLVDDSDFEGIVLARKKSKLVGAEEPEPEAKVKEEKGHGEWSSAKKESPEGKEDLVPVKNEKDKEREVSTFFNQPITRSAPLTRRSPTTELFKPDRQRSSPNSPPEATTPKLATTAAAATPSLAKSQPPPPDEFDFMLDDPIYFMLDSGEIPGSVIEAQRKALDQVKKKSPPKGKAMGKRPLATEKGDEERIPESPVKKAHHSSTSPKGKRSQAIQNEDDVDTDFEDTPKKQQKTPGKDGTPAPTTPSKKGGQQKEPETPEEEAERQKKKQDAFIQFKIREQRRAKPLHPGSKEIPVGEELCLQGLKFVFTGDLEALSRDDAVDLVRRHGGEVGSSVSGKTSYVVIGSDPGASKMDKVVKLKIRTLDEDQFYELIRTRPAQKAQISKEVAEIREERRKAEAREKIREAEAEAQRQREQRVREREQLQQQKGKGKDQVEEEKARDDDYEKGKDGFGKPMHLSPSSPVSPPPVALVALLSSSTSAATSRKSPPNKDATTSVFFPKEAISSLTKQISSSAAKAKEVVRPKLPVKTSELWTDKYRPRQMKDIIGNKGHVDRILHWLVGWPGDKVQSTEKEKGKAKAKAKDPKKDEISEFRALLISGPPGIGKTTAINVVAGEAGFEVLELNASDTRSKKSLHEEVSDLIGNRGIGEFYKPSAPGQKAHNRVVLVMEEVDGMSGSDRGGIGELVKLIQKTKIPIICVCNDSASPKMRPLTKCCYHVKFSRPDFRQIREKILVIAEKEGLRIDTAALDQIITGCGNDIRQIITALSCFRLGANSMNYDQSKHLINIAGKNVEMSFFDAAAKLLGPRAFQDTTIDELLDLYFVDFSILPLMIQENYLKCSPMRAKSHKKGDPTDLEMQYLCQAAHSISDGDLCSAIIHKDQEWSLLPVQGILSTVRPASYSHGAFVRGTGFGFGGGIDFPGWLGKNSSQQKFFRQLKDLHLHMSLRISGSRQEFRETYLPVLRDSLIQPLVVKGADGISESISLMEYYYLNREDLDNVMEIAHDFKRLDPWKGVNPQVKSAFTRTFNQMVHLVPYAEGTVTKGRARAAAPLVPDSEEAGDQEVVGAEDDENGDGEDRGDDKEDNDEEGVANDKMIKVKKASGGSKGGRGKAQGSSGSAAASSSSSRPRGSTR